MFENLTIGLYDKTVITVPEFFMSILAPRSTTWKTVFKSSMKNIVIFFVTYWPLFQSLQSFQPFIIVKFPHLVTKK